MGGWSCVVFGRFVFSAQLGINAGTWIHQENTQTWDISWIIQVPQNRACCRVYPWELSSCHQTRQWNIFHFSSMIFPMYKPPFPPIFAGISQPCPRTLESTVQLLNLTPFPRVVAQPCVFLSGMMRMTGREVEQTGQTAWIRSWDQFLWCRCGPVISIPW